MAFDDQKIGSLFVEVEARRDKFDSALTGIQADMKRAAAKMQSIGKTMSLAITAPLAGVGAAAVKVSSDMGSALENMEAQTTATEAQMDKVKQSTKEIASATGQSFKEIVDGFKFAMPVVKDASERFDLVKRASKATAMNMGELTPLIRAATTASKLMGDSVDSAGEALNDLVRVGQTAQVKVSSIGGSLGDLISIAQEAGLTFHEVLGFLAPVAEDMNDMGKASKRLRQVFTRLVKPGEKQKEVMRKLGSTFDELQRTVKKDGLLTALKQLKSDLNEAGMELGNFFRSSRRIEPVLNALANGGVEVSEATRIAARDTNTVNRAWRDFNTLANEAAKAWQKIKVALLPIGDILSNRVQTALKGVAGFIKTVADRFKNLDKKTQQQIVNWGIFVSTIGPALVILGTMVNALSGLVGLFGTLGTAVKGTWAILSGFYGTLSTVATFIATKGLGTAIMVAVEKLGVLGGMVLSTGGLIAGAFATAIGLALVAWQEGIGAMARVSIEFTKFLTTDLFTMILEGFERMLEAMKSAWSATFDTFTFDFSGVASSAQNYLAAFGIGEPQNESTRDATNTAEDIDKKIDSAVESFSGIKLDDRGSFEILGSTFDKTMKDIKGIFGGVKSGMGGLGDFLSGESVLGDKIKDAEDQLNNLGDDLNNNTNAVQKNTDAQKEKEKGGGKSRLQKMADAFYGPKTAREREQAAIESAMEEFPIDKLGLDRSEEREGRKKLKNLLDKKFDQFEDAQKRAEVTGGQGPQNFKNFVRSDVQQLFKQIQSGNRQSKLNARRGTQAIEQSTRTAAKQGVQEGARSFAGAAQLNVAVNIDGREVAKEVVELQPELIRKLQRSA